MSEKIIIDHKEYILYEYEEESKLEDDVYKNLTKIFGDNCLYCPKVKLKSYGSTSGGIPDGLLIDFNREKMYIVEVELGTHDLYEHVTPQMTRFKRLFQDHRVRDNITEIFHNLVKESKEISDKIKSKNEEPYHYIKKILDASEPNLILIIDVLNEETETIAKEDLNASMIVEFRKYKGVEGDAYKILIIDTQEKYRAFKKVGKAEESQPISVEEYLKDKDKKSVELFNMLREKISDFGNIEGFAKKGKIYLRDMKKQRTFIGFIVFKRKGRVAVWIDAGPNFEDPKQISKKWGSSRWFYVESKDEIDYAMNLIRQGYERR